MLNQACEGFTSDVTVFKKLNFAHLQSLVFSPESVREKFHFFDGGKGRFSMDEGQNGEKKMLFQIYPH